MVIEEAEVTMSADVNKQVIEDSTDQFVGVLNDSIKMMILAMIAAFIAIVALVPFAGRRLADALTRPLQVLTDGVREIASGNLDKKLDIKTGNEIEHLASCFNAMTDELKTYMSNRCEEYPNFNAPERLRLQPHGLHYQRDDEGGEGGRRRLL